MYKDIYKLNIFKAKVLNYITKGHKAFETEDYAKNLFIKMFPNLNECFAYATDYACCMQDIFYSESSLLYLITKKVK